MRIGVLGGGDSLGEMGILYEESCVPDTPYGKASSVVRQAVVEGHHVFTMLRHGETHAIAADQVNYRANIWAFASLKVDLLIGVSVCGTFSTEVQIGTVVAYSQIIDFTRGRKNTFFDQGIVRHTSMLDPTCVTKKTAIVSKMANCGQQALDGGTLIVIEGPRFSTRAESRMFRQWGGEFINMSGAPEAFLARELGICYVPLSLVTDGDDSDDDSVSMGRIGRSISQFRRAIPDALHLIIRNADSICALPCSCGESSEGTVDLSMLNLTVKPRQNS